MTKKTEKLKIKVFGKVRKGGKTKELDNERERKKQTKEQGEGISEKKNSNEE